ncbi:universal stress protein [Halorhabdus amylolytica]|uniref:universal stress protein n=1 Tax=Halorhabdus amylolytica TaxID=2559573 RepID=UPI0010AA7CBA|nr:universal stress protein [Halorhabdus amylolytica]
MYNRILFPIGDTDGPAEVLQHAGDIAQHLGGEIRLLHVADTERYGTASTDQDVIDGLLRRGEEIVEDAGETLAALDVEYSTDVVQGSPAQTIVEYATEYDYDLIVMPTHGRDGLARYLLGSVTEKVVRLATVPVLTARIAKGETFAFPYEHILVPTDGSDIAERAAKHALDLAVATDATVHALSVVEAAELGTYLSGDEPGEFNQEAQDAVADIATMAQSRDVEVTTHLEIGSPNDGILAAIEELDCQVVTMGTTGRRGVKRILLGSAAEKTVRTSPVPVVTVRGESEE